jgi:hypothetical protein
MHFDLTDVMEPFIQKCSKALIDRKPVEVRYTGAVDDLRQHAASNKEVLATILGKGANLYAIWTKPGDSNEWVPEYIGQRSKSSCAARLREHLFWKHEKTESKIARIREAVKAGRQVAVTTILVTPDCLRRAVEEALIDRHGKNTGWLRWNKHGRTKGHRDL